MHKQLSALAVRLPTNQLFIQSFNHPINGKRAGEILLASMINQSIRIVEAFAIGRITGTTRERARVTRRAVARLYNT